MRKYSSDTGTLPKMAEERETSAILNMNNVKEEAVTGRCSRGKRRLK
jgi:hypothetical protein